MDGSSMQIKKETLITSKIIQLHNFMWLFCNSFCSINDNNWKAVLYRKCAHVKPTTQVSQPVKKYLGTNKMGSSLFSFLLCLLKLVVPFGFVALVFLPSCIAQAF